MDQEHAFALDPSEQRNLIYQNKGWPMGREYMGTNRVTYVINEEGIIDHVITKVDNSNASQQVLDLYE